MREIKFRAWNIQENRWMTADEILERVLVNPAWDGKHFQIDEKLMNGLSQDIGYGFDLMQYTGLKDKNDVEIYEGDILQDEFLSGDIPVQVKWINEWSMFGVVHVKLEALIRWADTSVIVGNIYEHPHLIGGESDGN